MTPSGAARLAGVVGWPVAHSRSPRLHGFWLDRHGIDGAYVPLAVHPDNLDRAIRALPALGFRGVNVTVPHKRTVMPICDRIDPLADRIGAVNTIVAGVDGSLTGSNTDAFGFVENLRQSGEWNPAGGSAAVIGAGGAARAVCVGLIDAGVPEIRLVNRTENRARALADEFGPKIHAMPWARREDSLDGATLLVNTTSLGMTGQPALELTLDALPADAVVNDIVYAPLETDLLAAARARGNPVVDGLGMLLHQARPAFEAWFGVMPAVDDETRRFILADLGK